MAPSNHSAGYPPRSLLYVPGSNARALEKAAGLPADMLIVDLEDAVPADRKIEAREVKLLAGKLALKLEYGVVDDILDAGVHRWLTDFLAQSARLGDAIGKAYLEAN